MFKGQSFSTMILVPNGYTGSVTGSKIALDDDGELSQADPTDESTPGTDHQSGDGGQCAARHRDR
jgi:hypothetical protein